MPERPSADSVLPLLPAVKGWEELENVDDLLTDEQKSSLRADLAAMAKLRRRAEAESANIILGAQIDGSGAAS